MWRNPLKIYQILWRLYNKQMTRCDNRGPQTVSKGRKPQISFSYAFMFFAIFRLFSILFSSLHVYSIYFFSPLFIQTTTFHNFHGWGLSTGWHLSSLLQDKVNICNKSPLALFFLPLLLCSRFLIHPSRLDQIFRLSSLSFIWPELSSEQIFCSDLCLIDFSLWAS